jgi:GAF domain-containing protein
MLQQMTSRLYEKRTFEAAINTILDDVIALHGAQFGDVQLPIKDELVLVAQRGLSRPFLEAFKRVKKDDGCACGQALRAGKPVVIADVQTDVSYAPFRADASAAGYRGVQSTPLFTEEGTLIGMVSTLFATPHRPTAIEMQTLEQYARIAVAYLVKLLGQSSVSKEAEEMSNALYERQAAL